ncbi:MAG: sensor histidine kinase [Solirubrobacteraceae bacterium]
MLGLNKRLALAALLGVLIAAGLAGLAVVLAQGRSPTQAQLRASAQNRASLAAALINSVFSGAYQSPAPVKAPLSRVRVTSREIATAQRDSPLTAVIGPTGAMLATQPALPLSTRQLIASQPAVAAALADGRHHISGLLPATGHTPPGFLDVTPYQTRFGTRVTATWLPLAAVTAVLDRYLAYVAHDRVHQRQAQVLLLDGNHAVIGSAGRMARGQPLSDRALRAGLERKPGSGRFGPGGDRLFAAAPLSVAPWTVVYAISTDAPYAIQGSAWDLSLLLAGFGAVAAVCVALLIGLLKSADKLARVNAALGRRNDEVERATEAKSRFVANMSHELRTPLNAVIGFAELMQAGRAGRLTKTQHEYLGIVRAGGDHLLSLINEALDLATVEAGEMRLRPEVVQPSQVARHCVTGLRPLADEREVRIELESEQLDVALLDPGRLRQVILNYLSNAIKFSHVGGRVTLRIAHEDDRLTLAVTDEGIGITPEDQQRVFEEFVQLSERSATGSGLGLAVTRRIVEAHGGEVAVRSRRGEGSTFTAWFPWVEPDDDAAPGDRDGSSPASEADPWRQVISELTPHAPADPAPVASPLDELSLAAPRPDRRRFTPGAPWIGESRRRRGSREGR